jgi:hypothetical protein
MANKYITTKVRYSNARAIATVSVNGEPKLVATERDTFAGGWMVKTINGLKLGFFPTLNNIELFAKGEIL